MKNIKIDNNGPVKSKRDLKKREKLLKILHKKRKRLQYKQQGIHPSIKDKINLRPKILRKYKDAPKKFNAKNSTKPLRHDQKPIIDQSNHSTSNHDIHNQSDKAPGTQTIQKFNAIEKLIKLDRKYSNFDIIYYKSKKKLKIRNQIGASAQNALQNNFGLRAYWKHIAQQYFKPLEQSDNFRINYLQSLTNLPIIKKEMKYSDMNSYQAVKKIISKNGYLNNHLSLEVNQQNYKNLLKHILISTKLSYLTNHYKQDLSYDDLNELDHSAEILHNKYISRYASNRRSQEHQKDSIKFEAELKQFLDNENKHLDQIIEIINSQDQNEDSLGKELDRLIAEVRVINNQNRERLTMLRKDIDKELYYSKGYPFTLRNDPSNSWKFASVPYYEINENKFFTLVNYQDLEKSFLMRDRQIPSTPSKGRKPHKLQQNWQSDKFAEIVLQQEQMVVINNITFFINAFNDVGLQVQKEYFKYIILFLEARQLIESISFIRDTKKNDRQFLYEVQYEEAYDSKSNWIEEQLLLNLDKCREYSLFSAYLVPTKSARSYIAQNFYGFNKIIQKKSKEIEKGETLIKYMRNQRENIKQNYLNSKLDQFKVCHHCKLFYCKEQLVACNYRSSINGLPINNFVLQEPSLYNLEFDKPTSSQNSPVNRKRNNFNFFNRKDGELNCERSFCKQCLKLNYDINIVEVLNKNDWICPFCSGVCYCTRCLRNEMILKLKNFSFSIGLEIQKISKNLIFERFTETPSERKIRKNKLKDKNKKAMREQKEKEQENLKKEIQEKNIIDNEKNKIIQAVKSFKKKQKQFGRVKKIRINMEKFRMICSQVLRREKLKTKINYLEQDIFEQQLRLIREEGIIYNQDLIQVKKKKGRKRKIKINFEDKISQISSIQKRYMPNRSEKESIESQGEESQSRKSDQQNLSLFHFERKTPSTTSYISQITSQSGISPHFIKKKNLKLVRKFQKSMRHRLKQNNIFLKSAEKNEPHLTNQQIQCLVKKENLSQNENPNELNEQNYKQPKLKKELFKIFEYQDPKQFSLLFNENVKENCIHRKLLRSKTGGSSQLNSYSGGSQNNNDLFQLSQSKNK